MSDYRYTYNYTSGDLVFDFIDEIVYCENTITVLDMQGLINGCREAEDSWIGIEFPSICRASGKNNLDVSTGVQIGITVELLGNWRIFSQKTSGKFVATAGNLIQGGSNLGGDPFEPNPLVNYISIQSAASTIVSVSSGSGLSTEEHNRLMALPTVTLTPEQDSKLMAIPEETLTTEEHDQLMIITTDGLLSEQRAKELILNRNNTISNRRIVQYVAGGDTTVDVAYDADGVPSSEVIQAP